MDSELRAELRRIQDRNELRDLVNRYARGADRRDWPGMAAVFLPDGRLVNHLTPRVFDDTPKVRTGREEIAAAMKGLERYLATTHLVANQVLEVDGDRATGETYCVAHHIYVKDGVERDRVMSIRYQDEYARTDEGWRIATRTLNCDWIEDRPVTS